MRYSSFAFATLALLLSGQLDCVSTAYGQSPRRVALVVGNSEYSDAPLKNPSNDADVMGDTLSRLGFDVTKLKDVGKLRLEEAVDSVTRGLRKGDACIIFFAGHGMQMNNENYLVPVGATIDEPQHVKQRCVAVSYFLDALQFSDCSLKIVVVDACRNNPFRGFRRSAQGLATLRDAPEGTIVSFSTSPKTTALDGQGTNSPYVQSLTKVLNDRADQADIVRVFREASQLVRASTGQKPYLEFDASMPDFFLRRPNPPKTQVTQKNAKTFSMKPQTSTPKPTFDGVLEGTTWHGHDSEGDEFHLIFQPNGVLHYSAGRGLRKNGVWTVADTGRVSIKINDGFANLEGSITGSEIKGTGSSLGFQPWTWTAALQ